MNLPFELHIALRYLLAKRKQAFISVISFISTLGVTVGVMALVIALAIMTGLGQGIHDRLLAATPHMYVFKRGGITDYPAEIARLKQVPHVIGASPVILGKALLTAGDSQAFVSLQGIEPATQNSVIDIGAGIKSGSLEALGATDPEAPDGILLGTVLATQLGVTTGDAISVLTTQGTLTPMGMWPRVRQLRVVGIFSLDLPEFDEVTGYVSLDVAKRLLADDHSEAIQVRVDEIFRAPDVAHDVTSRLGVEYVTQDWTELNGELFSALTLEKIGLSAAVFLIVMVAALNIVASLILLVMEKHRDIAILKTMGASGRSIMLIFLMQGVIIGVIGTTVGATAGAALSYFADKYRWVTISANVYQVPYLPFKVLPLDFTMVVVSAILVCFLATLYPSRQAARLDPAEALRH
jgi:lipoprotein-releasing system permease protein